ncbi:MAG: DHH family phosphoesterase [Treponemataceae bacterium]
MVQNDIDRFKAFLEKYSTFIIAGHKEPDGDCISSCLVANDLLHRLNKKTYMVSAGPFLRPETRQYELHFSSTLPNLSEREKAETAVLIVDCSGYDRTGSLEESLKDFPFFVIDHHKTADATMKNSIIDWKSPATVYLLQQIYESLLGSLPSDLAQVAFFGLSTDTGFFRFLTEKDADVFAAASRLVSQGVNPKKIYAHMTGGKTFNSRKLLGNLLARTETFFDGKLALTYETFEESETLGKTGRDSDALYSLLLCVENVEVVVVIRQESKENCTIGFRSQDKIDVSIIASTFGGGGHKNASGASTQGTINSVKSDLLEAFEKVL